MQSLRQKYSNMFIQMFSKWYTNSSEMFYQQQICWNLIHRNLNKLLTREVECDVLNSQRHRKIFSINSCSLTFEDKIRFIVISEQSRAIKHNHQFKELRQKKNSLNNYTSAIYLTSTTTLAKAIQGAMYKVFMVSY